MHRERYRQREIGDTYIYNITHQQVNTVIFTYVH